jgi:hypothetical protein
MMIQSAIRLSATRAKKACEFRSPLPHKPTKPAVPSAFSSSRPLPKQATHHAVVDNAPAPFKGGFIIVPYGRKAIRIFMG